MVNRKQIQMLDVDHAHRLQQSMRLGVVLNLCARRVVGQRKNFPRAIIRAGDESARFVRRVEE